MLYDCGRENISLLKVTWQRVWVISSVTKIRKRTRPVWHRISPLYRLVQLKKLVSLERKYKII